MTAHTSARALVIAVVLIALSHDPRAQQAPQVIRGRVVAADNAAALPRAHIEVMSGGRVVQSIFADDQGRFTIPVSDEGMFVRVEKAGFVADRLTIMPKDARGEVLHVPLSRAASIAGRVTDASGEPLQDVQVTAARVNPPVNDGGRFPDRIAAVTNDLGEYRFGGLTAGRYRISIFSSERDSLPTIEIRPGDELGPIDFVDPHPVRAAQASRKDCVSSLEAARRSPAAFSATRRSRSRVRG
jgi:hypothetical protein